MNLCVSIVRRGWRYARWLLLKGIAQLPLGLFFGAARADRYIIELGNVLFPREFPDSIFLSYETYVEAFPARLDVYHALIPDQEWIKGKRILDLGAGLGQYSSALIQAGASDVLSLEYQQVKASFARERFGPRNENITFLVASAQAIPLPADCVDTVFSHTVFEHLPDPEIALREIQRVLHPDGVVLLSFNFLHNQGGHHLFPYVHFPWAPWIVKEEALCDYWTERLKEEQTQGRAGFFPAGCQIRSLGEGNEIHLNKMDFSAFEDAITRAGLQRINRWVSEPLARQFPSLLKIPVLNRFFTETIYYVLGKGELRAPMHPPAGEIRYSDGSMR